jgi:DNA-binding NarL/FixJ family response regulator
MDGYCSDCDKRFTCHELCPEALVQVNHDAAAWREAPVSYYYDGEALRVFDTRNNVEKPLFSRMERAVLCRLGQCKSKKIIAKELNISRHYLKILMLRIKNKTARLFTFVEG